MEESTILTCVEVLETESGTGVSFDDIVSMLAADIIQTPQLLQRLKRELDEAIQKNLLYKTHSNKYTLQKELSHPDSNHVEAESAGKAEKRKLSKPPEAGLKGEPPSKKLALDATAGQHAKQSPSPANDDAGIVIVEGKPHQIIKMVGDGACLYRAVSFLLHGTQAHHLQLRRDVVTHILENWSDLQVYTQTPHNTMYESKQKYKQAMLNPEEFATTLEIEVAAILSNRSIVIQHRDGTIIKFADTNPVLPPLRIIFTGSHEGGHFDALMEIKNDLDDSSSSNMNTPNPGNEPTGSGDDQNPEYHCSCCSKNKKDSSTKEKPTGSGDDQNPEYHCSCCSKNKKDSSSGENPPGSGDDQNPEYHCSCCSKNKKDSSSGEKPKLHGISKKKIFSRTFVLRLLDDFLKTCGLAKKKPSE